MIKGHIEVDIRNGDLEGRPTFPVHVLLDDLGEGAGQGGQPTLAQSETLPLVTRSRVDHARACDEDRDNVDVHGAWVHGYAREHEVPGGYWDARANDARHAGGRGYG